MPDFANVKEFLSFVKLNCRTVIIYGPHIKNTKKKAFSPS